MALHTTNGNTHGVSHGSASALDNLAAATVGVLCWPASIGNDRGLAAKRSTVSNGWSWLQHGANGSFQLTVVRATQNLQVTSAGGEFVAGAWQWAFCTWDINGADADQRLYHGLLGAPITEVSYQTQQVGSGAKANDGPLDLVFMQQRSTLAAFGTFTGRFALVCLWNRQLTLAEIRAVVRDPWRPHFAPLVYSPYGRFGSVAAPDWSGNGNHGAITGATLAPNPPLEVRPAYRRGSVLVPVAGGPPPSQVLDGAAALDAWDATNGQVSPGAVALAGTPAADPWAAISGVLAVGAVALVGVPAPAPWAVTTGALVPGVAVLAGNPALDAWQATTGGLGSGSALLAGNPVLDAWDAAAGVLEPGASPLAGVPAADPWAATSGELITTSALVGVPAQALWGAATGAFVAGPALIAGSPALDEWHATAGALDVLSTLAGAPAADGWAATQGTLATGAALLAGTPATDPWTAAAGALLTGLSLAGSPATELWSATTGTLVASGVAPLVGKPALDVFIARSGALAPGGVALDGTPAAELWVATTGAAEAIGINLRGAPATDLWAAAVGALAPGAAALSGASVQELWGATIGRFGFPLGILVGPYVVYVVSTAMAVRADPTATVAHAAGTATRVSPFDSRLTVMVRSGA